MHKIYKVLFLGNVYNKLLIWDNPLVIYVYWIALGTNVFMHNNITFKDLCSILGKFYVIFCLIKWRDVASLLSEFDKNDMLLWKQVPVKVTKI